MEIKNFDSLKYWQVLGENVGGWIFIVCPIMNKPIKEFRVKRGIYKELLNLEKMVVSKGLRGWVGYTRLDNAHIMRMFAKLNAIPFFVDLKKDRLWFKKKLGVENGNI